MQFDWIQISYKSIKKWLVFFLFPLALVVASLFLLKPSGEAKAQEAINKASLAHREAVELANSSRDPNDLSLVAEAAEALTKAKSLKIENDFVGALEACRRATELSDRVINRAPKAPGLVSTVRFDELIGEVMVKRAGATEYVAANKKMILEAGDMVQTSPSASCRLVFYDGMITVVRPRSLVTIKDAFKNRESAENFINLRLETGNLTLRSTQHEKRAKPSVLTKSGSAMVYHQSQVAVEYSALVRETQLDVYSGRATAATGAKTIDVRQNQRITFGDDHSLSDLVELPPPPQLVRPEKFAKFKEAPDGTASVILGWRAVDPTASYRVELSPNILFTEFILEEDRYFRNQIEFPNLSSGVYFWRVASTNSANVTGAPSEVWQFQIGKELISSIKAVDTKPPFLTVQRPSIHGYLVIVTGKSETTATVQVDGQKAILDTNTGEFSYTANMPGAGIHTIHVVAEDPAGNRTHKEILVEIKD